QEGQGARGAADRGELVDRVRVRTGRERRRLAGDLAPGRCKRTRVLDEEGVDGLCQLLRRRAASVDDAFLDAKELADQGLATCPAIPFVRRVDHGSPSF